MLDYWLVHTTSDWPLYPLIPGSLVSLILTGGHGGTEVQEIAGHIALVVVNTVLYTLAIVLLLQRIIGDRERGERAL